MAQYRIMDADELLQCPYERSHMVRSKRFQYHLMRCRKNYSGRDFVSCPFNAKHEMPKPELRYHLTQCPDKALLNQEFAHELQKAEGGGDGVQFKGCTDLPPSNDFEVPTSEDWGSESNGPSHIGVDVSHFSKFRFKDRTGYTPSEKKQLNKANNVPIEEKLRTVLKDSEERGMHLPSGPLRLPKTTPVAMAMPQHVKPQPTPAVFAFAYSQGHDQQQNGAVNGVATLPTGPYGRGRGQGIGVMGVGRGIGMSLPQELDVVQPPGFYGRGRGFFAAEN